jgi:hypothetical protein
LLDLWVSFLQSQVFRKSHKKASASNEADAFLWDLSLTLNVEVQQVLPQGEKVTQRDGRLAWWDGWLA